VEVTLPPKQATRQAHPERTLLVLASDFPEAPEAVDGYAVQAAEGWAELAERVRVAAPSTIAVVRVEASGDAAELRGLMRATPSVPVVAAVSFRQAGAAQVGALLMAGIAEIVNLDMLPVLAGMVPTLRRAHARPLKRRLEAGLPVWAAETVVDRGGRPRFAGIFGVYVRTVAIKSRELNLPPPRRLLAWVRVLLALSLLEESERTVINVTHVCGYRDNSSLKRAIENFTSTPALASIRDQSFAAAFDRFASELRDLRLGTHSRTAAPRPGSA
jgi:AraC-like DNA-binding protein